MESSTQVSEEESWHLAYSVFIFTLQALASSPEEACAAMGSCNTAWELKDDGMAGEYLLGRGHLSAEQEMAVRQLLEQLRAVPASELPSGEGLAPNLAAMRHPAWQPVRASAAALLGILGPVTASSRAYLEWLGNAP
jgi:hypothetical protein